MSTHLSAFTLPLTRAAAVRLYKKCTWRRSVAWWIVAMITLAAFASLRGTADNMGMPIQGSGAENRIFGSLPTLWLQRNVYPISPGFGEWAAVVVHASWFFVCPMVALFVTWKRPQSLGSFFKWWIALECVGLLIFALFPMRPPWMADPAVTRIIAQGGNPAGKDPNPLAAMPSLHVAFPLLMAVWFCRERWWRPAAGMFTYAAVIAFEVVFSGEHYIVDVIGAGLVVATIALVARINAAQFARRALSAAAAPAALWRHLPRRAPSPAFALDPVANAQERESGQALIEFAFVFPILIVLLLSLIDFGIAVDHRDVLQHAVREGARNAAVGNSTGTVQQYASDESQGLLATTDVTVCYKPEGSIAAGAVGSDVQVSATYKYKFSVGGGEVLSAMGVGPPSIDLSTSADARLEQAVSGATACT
jgi:PAP2 superfamily/TadE-like protein